MNIQILNRDLTLHGILTGYESLVFTKAWNSKGSFTLRINANNKNAKYIAIDKILYIDENTIGYIKKVTIDRKTDKANEFIIAEGVELEDKVGRVIYPNSGLENDSYSNAYLETIVKSIIQKNASGTAVIPTTGTAAAKRQIPKLKVATDQNRGLQIDYSARYKDMVSEIYTLLSSQGMGLKASIDFENSAILFDVATGNDLTATEGEAGGIILSLDTKTAQQITETDDKLTYKNLSVTAGQGEGADRAILEVYTEDEEPEGYDREEIFTDARDVNTNDELSTRGAQKLTSIGKTKAIACKANELGAYQVGDDYTLGDLISVDAYKGLYSAQVIKLKYTYTKAEIPQIDVVLNFDANDILIKTIHARNMDYNALVSNDYSKLAKNLLINSNFAIDQLGNTTYTASGYTLDQWYKLAAGTAEQVIINEPGSKYALKLTGDGSALSVHQKIENPNNELYNKETTISFWAKGSISMSVLRARLYNQTKASWIDIKAYDVSAEWTKIKITFAASTNWDNDDIIRIYIAYGAIPDGETVTIKQAKFEIGTIATDFVPRTYSEELILCQRYYYRIEATAANQVLTILGTPITATSLVVPIILPTTMRIAPSSVSYASLRGLDGVSSYAITALAVGGTTLNSVQLYAVTSGSFTVYRPTFIAASASGGYIALDARL